MSARRSLPSPVRAMVIWMDQNNHPAGVFYTPSLKVFNSIENFEREWFPRFFKNNMTNTIRTVVLFVFCLLASVAVSHGQAVTPDLSTVVTCPPVEVAPSTMIQQGPRGIMGPRGFDGLPGRRGPQGPKGDPGVLPEVYVYAIGAALIMGFLGLVLGLVAIFRSVPMHYATPVNIVNNIPGGFGGARPINVP